MIGHGWVLADVLFTPLTAIVIIVPVVTRVIPDAGPRAIVNQRIIWIFKDGKWVL
jgi:hypothetical protein